MSATVASPASTMATHGLGLDWNTADPVEVRRHIRSGEYRGHTGALAQGFVQANLAILPADYAAEFAHFCQRNPKPCPLLAMSEPGDPRLPELGEDLDLRTDLPSYRVFRDGELDGDVRQVGHGIDVDPRVRHSDDEGAPPEAEVFHHEQAVAIVQAAFGEPVVADEPHVGVAGLDAG